MKVILLAAFALSFCHQSVVAFWGAKLWSTGARRIQGLESTKSRVKPPVVGDLVAGEVEDIRGSVEDPVYAIKVRVLIYLQSH